MNEIRSRTGDTDSDMKTNGKPFVLKPVQGALARLSSDNVCVSRSDFLHANEVLAGKVMVHEDTADAPAVSVTDDGYEEQFIQQGQELSTVKRERDTLLQANQRLTEENERLKGERDVADVFSLKAVQNLWQLPLNARNETYVPTRTNISVVTQLLNTDVRITPIELPMRYGDPEARIGVPNGYVVKVTIESFQDGERYMLTYHHPDLDEPIVRFRPLKGLKVVRIEHESSLVIELTFFRQREGAVMKAFSLKMLSQRAANVAMKDERLSSQLGAGEPGQSAQLEEGTPPQQPPR